MKEGLRSRVEGVSTRFGSVNVRDGRYYAETFLKDGEVPIPGSVAETIIAALNLRQKVDEKKSPHLARAWALLNCRKSVFAVTGQLSVKDIVRRTHDRDGVELLFQDIERLQSSSYEGIHFMDGNDIVSALDEYEGSFPCIVHLFEYDIMSPAGTAIEASIRDKRHFSGTLLAKMHRLHTFLVLGQAQEVYVCFQKKGPHPDDPFTISSIDFVPTKAKETRRGVAFIGPADYEGR